MGWWELTIPTRHRASLPTRVATRTATASSPTRKGSRRLQCQEEGSRRLQCQEELTGQECTTKVAQGRVPAFKRNDQLIKTRIRSPRRLLLPQYSSRDPNPLREVDVGS